MAHPALLVEVRRLRLPLVLFSLLPLVLLESRPAAEPRTLEPAKLELRQNDHICIIGNTLAERMQHDGWLETLLHARFPAHQLTFRNLAFSGDELNVRLRTQSFGTPDQWLSGHAPIPEPSRLVTRKGVRDNRFETTQTRADVVFAFFGYNESFGDVAGLPRFKEELTEFVRHTLKQRYNGKTPPRLVLFSPIAHQNLKNPSLPDGRENNRRLELYTRAMAEVAGNEGVVFVDLFQPTLQRFADSSEALTINGIHQNAAGNEFVARCIDRALFSGPAATKLETAALAKLRQAVCDQNLHWFSRYRVVDGYNVYGGRAFEKYADQQSNYEDQQRELEILDVMTQNRERRVWALAQGRDEPVDDRNCPPLIPVKTNKPGTGPGGAHVYLDATEAIQRMTVAPGFRVELFASEKEFPELAKPVQMQFDTKGRLWVAVWPSYPRWKPTEKMDDKILIFEDTQGTGRADKCTVFASGLNCPTGFEFCPGGILVAQAPDLVMLRDTDGDDRADQSERVLHGLSSGDTHHTANSFTYDPGGAIYFQEGTFHRTVVESPYGPPRRCADGAVYRYQPRQQRFDVYVTHPFANPHGHVWDRWGQDFVYDGTGAQPYHGALFSGYLDFPQKHPSPPQVYAQRTRPCPAVEILSSRRFPADWQGNLLVANVIGFLGILRYRVHDQGASFGATETTPLLSSTDPNFRPCDLKVGPDGAVWFIDWHNPIIGHLQHAIRDPSRDRTHGRIYRVVPDSPAAPADTIAGQPVPTLLELLKHPEDRVRYRTRTELAGRPTPEVMSALDSWLARLASSDPEVEHHRLEGLWLRQAHDRVDPELLGQVLASPDFRARAAAVRVLVDWRERLPDSLARLRQTAGDAHPRVRLEAVRGASFFSQPEAIEAVLIVSDHSSDVYLDYVRQETLRALEPRVRSALARGWKPVFQTAAGKRWFLKALPAADLVKLLPEAEAGRELLFRPGVLDDARARAVAALARQRQCAEPQVLLEALKANDALGDSATPVVFDLGRLLLNWEGDKLKPWHADLVNLAENGQTFAARELGFVAWIAADGSVDSAWTRASVSCGSLIDFLSAVPVVRDPSLRASLFPRIAQLLGEDEAALKVRGASPLRLGRYVRVELPGPKRTLTLAEVEVLSQGVNVAPRGKARQSSTAHGGSAERAVDGNTSGLFASGGQTHTREDTVNPWWELDLGSELPLEAVVLHNRTDGQLGKRLENCTVRILDEQRHSVAVRTGLAAPNPRLQISFKGDAPLRQLRRAAMNALLSMRGQETATFNLLVASLDNDADRDAAYAALLKLPANSWPREAALKALPRTLAWLRGLPTDERDTTTARTALDVARGFASLLPPEEAKSIRQELRQFGPQALRLGTLPERMAFDQDRLVVQAGQAVELLLENPDLMPHNWVLLQPGALEEVGELAEASATQPTAAERSYVPSSSKILAASRLLGPRESQVLRFTAPRVPGIYPFVCTYPGHWRRMWGALYVVADSDEYEASPESYLARSGLVAKDALLRQIRPRTEWSLAELEPPVTALSRGRSFAQGKQMFQVANCVACHRLNGVGNEFGPDLAKLEPRLVPVEVLKELLEPSAKINDKFQVFTFELESGKLVTGLVLEESKERIKLVENPLAKAEPIALRLADIVNRQKSAVSLMPKGLLDKLSREEVLDLIAYVAARGDASHSLFQAEANKSHSHGGK